ncbi:MAG: L,D-transpeptidase family protein [Myxococcales bacterium]|nr:L,D-transpeptidase family protein [Myxococcales bacterium]
MIVERRSATNSPTRQRLRRAWCVSLAALCLVACGTREEPPGVDEKAEKPNQTHPKASGAAPSLPAELTQTANAQDAGAEAEDAAVDAAPYTGPWFAVTKIAAAVFAEPKFDQKQKLGYIRNGGRVPVDPKPVSTTNCSSGWYHVNGVGYVCGNLGTTDMEHPEVKFAIKAPDLAEVLPYVYARNAKNGTPLYRSVPSKEQMLDYEPYLDPKKKAEEKAKAEAEKKAKEAAKAAEKAKAEASKDAKDAKDAKAEKSEKTDEKADSQDGGAKASDKPVAEKDTPSLIDGIREKSSDKSAEKSSEKSDETPQKSDDKADPKPTRAASASPGELGDAPEPGDEGDAGAPDQPWWQRDNIKDKLHEVTLEQLSADADDILAKRMVTGFYVAVDKTFRWNGRTWYKTTKGLVTPADRFWQTAGSKFQGTELGTKYKLPLAWAYGGRKTAPTYEIDDKRRVHPKERIKRFEPLQLTGKEVEIRGITYSEMADGQWVKNIHVRITRPGPMPEDLKPDERWIDVNLKEQTLVAYKGSTPVYATLVSSGKTSSVKKKDHSTPEGEFRIREKHVTTTMDGDGTAAGDLPYSIEDVPYVMYYKGSYALHAAFWHSNYGIKMSHGCVNLSPLDAKWVFLFTDPQLPKGWHGVWATDGRPGSRVRVHE